VFVTVPGICEPILFLNPSSEVALPTWGRWTAQYFQGGNIVPSLFDRIENGKTYVKRSIDEPVVASWSYLKKGLITLTVIGPIVLAVMLIAYRFFNKFEISDSTVQNNLSPAHSSPQIPRTRAPSPQRDRPVVEYEAKRVALNVNASISHASFIVTAMEHRDDPTPAIREKPIIPIPVQPVKKPRNDLHPLLRGRILLQVVRIPTPVTTPQILKVPFFRREIIPHLGRIASFLTPLDFQQLLSINTFCDRTFHNIVSLEEDSKEARSRPFFMRVTYVKESVDIDESTKEVRKVKLTATAAVFKIGYNLTREDTHLKYTTELAKVQSEANHHLQNQLGNIEIQMKKLFPKAEVIFDRLNLNDSVISFNGVMYKDDQLIRHRRINQLMMRNTLFIEGSLSHWNRLNQIRELRIDGCNLVQKDLSDLVKYKTNGEHLRVFHYINDKKPITPTAALNLAHAFPNLQEMYVTLSKECYQIAFRDPVLLAPMHKMLAFCEHVSQKESLDGMRESGRTVRCAECRAFPNSTVDIIPLIWKCSRVQNGIQLQVVDAQRKPLTDRSWYHKTCGNIFDATKLTKEQVVKQKCNGCDQLINPSELIPVRLLRVEEVAKTKTLEEMVRMIALGENGQFIQNIVKEGKKARKTNELNALANALGIRASGVNMTPQDMENLRSAIVKLMSPEQSQDKTFTDPLIEQLSKEEPAQIQAVIDEINTPI
jgi:hypothetical protein